MAESEEYCRNRSRLRNFIQSLAFEKLLDIRIVFITEVLLLHTCAKVSVDKARLHFVISVFVFLLFLFLIWVGVESFLAIN